MRSEMAGFSVCLLCLILPIVVGLWLLPGAAQEPPRFTAPQPCWDNLACLRERVMDLKDYREFQDDQIALLKALNRDLTAELQKARAEIEARTPSLPPREPAK